MNKGNTTVALNELDSAKLLESCGINVARSKLLTSPAGIANAVKELGFPIVMKVLSNDILHKTDAGCVMLNICSVGDMTHAYETILRNAGAYAPNARIQGVLVQQMLPKGFEVLLGVSSDAQFGHVLMVGLGGIYVELLKQFSLRLLPITRRDALDMVAETPLESVFGGLRGVKYDKEQLIEAMMGLSTLIEMEPDITEVDINPLMFYSDGRKATAVDAMVIKSID